MGTFTSHSCIPTPEEASHDCTRFLRRAATMTSGQASVPLARERTARSTIGSARVSRRTQNWPTSSSMPWAWMRRSASSKPRLTASNAKRPATAIGSTRTRASTPTDATTPDARTGTTHRLTPSACSVCTCAIHHAGAVAGVALVRRTHHNNIGSEFEHELPRPGGGDRARRRTSGCCHDSTRRRAEPDQGRC